MATIKTMQSEGRKLGSLLSDMKPNGKLRQSKKHRISPDKFKQMTLRLTHTEAIKSPRKLQQLYSLDQSKDETVSPDEEN